MPFPYSTQQSLVFVTWATPSTSASLSTGSTTLVPLSAKPDRHRYGSSQHNIAVPLLRLCALALWLLAWDTSSLYKQRQQRHCWFIG
jgi:hypothetical protein